MLVIGSLHTGGAERQLVTLANELSARKWVVTLFALETGGALRDALDPAVTCVEGAGPVGPRLISRGWGALKAAWQLAQVVRAERPAVVQAFLPLTNLLGALIGRALGVPCVATSKRGLATHQDRHAWWAPIERVGNKLSHAVIANAFIVRDDAVRREGLLQDDVVVIPNGVDTTAMRPMPETRRDVRREMGLSPNDVAIISLANLSPAKGHIDLIDAFASMECAESRLFIAGEDRGAEQAIRSAIAASPAGSRITLLGLVRDVPRLLSGMDIGTLASHEEGCPNAVLEMLACGLPVVATAVGDVPRLAAEVPGLAVVPAHSPPSLAGALSLAIGNLGHLRGTTLERHRWVAGTHSVATMVDAYESVYHSRLTGSDSFD